MKTNIVISLDTRRAKKDGTFPIILRLGHQNMTLPIPTGLSVKEKDWNEKDRVVKSGYGGVSSVARLNNMLQKKKSEAMNIIVKLEEDGELDALTVNELKDRLTETDGSPSFTKFTEGLIKELKKAGQIGTARSYKGVNAVLKTFNGDRDLLFKRLNYDFLIRFEKAHLAKGLSYNGLAVYMRTIKAICNKAVKAKAVKKDFRPFEHYKIRTVPTVKRALDVTQLQAIVGLTLKPGVKCFNPRNYFVASYMMYGMNYIDMAFLKKADIANGRIQYRRSKTSKLYDIKIVPQLHEILSYYTGLNPDSEYVFPILKRDDLAGQHKEIQWSRKRYNKGLKAVAARCGIEGNLTSYVSRHSFATHAAAQQIPLQAISAMLGHSSLKTTQVYLKQLPTDILDDYNAKILAS